MLLSNILWDNRNISNDLSSLMLLKKEKPDGLLAHLVFTNP